MGAFTCSSDACSQVTKIIERGAYKRRAHAKYSMLRTDP